MPEPITWTIMYQKSMLDDAIRLLSGLNRDGQQNLGNLNRYMPAGAGADRKKNILRVLDDVNFVESKKMAHGTLYKITNLGRYYLDSIDEYERNDIFHSNLYLNIIHYSYAFDYIIENDYYSFKKNDFLEQLVLNSSNDFGIRIYDRLSGENVINFMKDLGIISLKDKEYVVNERYRRKFNNRKFLEMVIDNLKDEKLQFTKSLCEYLLDNSSKFMVSKDPLTIELIYKKLLTLNESKEILVFIPGLPRPPIPSRHSLVDLKGVL